MVIDEFHHAAADSYQRVLEYFTPKFLLGLTATPHRMDNQDIFAICDYNVAYEVDLFSAIQKDWLVPFRYYGIYDHTVDYSGLTIHYGRYREEDLDKALSVHERADLILKHFLKYKGRKTMAFCATIHHAETMASYFQAAGIPALAVHSQSENRKQAVTDLRSGRISVIFTVDIFNEGVDIPDLEMVMFLRPTESPIIFLQQLGRGLRKNAGKDFLIVLDFIGNHKKIDLLPKIFSGFGKREGTRSIRDINAGKGVPPNCLIDFDFRIIDLVDKQRTQIQKLQEWLREEYIRIQLILGRLPMRVDMLRMMDADLYSQVRKINKQNIFRDYLSFLESMGDTSVKQLTEKASAREFIQVLEKTAMSKMYKLPVIKTFFDRRFWNDRLEGEQYPLFKLTVTDDELIRSFRAFYTDNGQNALDMYQHKETKKFRSWDNEQYRRRIFDNPVHFLAKSHDDFFQAGDASFSLSSTLMPHQDDHEFVRHVLDILEFRRLEYLRNRLSDKEDRLYRQSGR